MAIRAQRGPKPIGWITVEIGGCLLIGELFPKGLGWRFECEEIPSFTKFGVIDSAPFVNKFVKEATRRAQQMLNL